MLYFEHDHEHWLVWPVIALGLGEEFWISIGWLNLEFGWRSGDGWGDHENSRNRLSA